MPAPTLTDLLEAGVAGRTVLIRSDLNVPLDGDTVTDDGRIRASLPAIRDLAEAGARVIVMAHLGRPKGEPDPAYSLRPVAARMAELLGTDVALAADVTGDDARAQAAALQDGQVLLLENVRFDARETSKDDAERAALAGEMAALAGDDGAYVGDAFGAVHRKHASVFDVAAQLPAHQGPLVAAELEVLTRLTESPERPYVVVLGGSKVSDKLAVIDNLLDKADTLLIGGGHLGQADIDTNSTVLDWRKLQISARTVSELFPVMRSATIVRAWAGIEGKLADDLPVVGPSLRHKGLFYQCGFSLHGFQLGPAAGAAVAELVTEGRTPVDISGLSMARFNAA